MTRRGSSSFSVSLTPSKSWQRTWVKRGAVALVVVAAALFSSQQVDWPAVIKSTTSVDVSAWFPAQPVVVPPAGSMEVAFSPNEGAAQLVVKVIDAAQTEVLVMAYSFTSQAVTQALLRARQRGVPVALVVDAQHNDNEHAQKALHKLRKAGAQVRTISAYAIHHDKVIIVDRATVQLGSFNYSEAAARSNSENVLVVWNNPELAQSYWQHFRRNWNQGRNLNG